MKYSGHVTMSTTTNRLEGKVAIVTGGASGIGESTVRLFIENVAQVIIADIHDQLGRTIAEQLCSRVSYIRCDVSVEKQVRDLVDAAISQHGRLDIMYNNAGILDRFGGSILDSTASDLDRILNVNLCGAFYGAKHAARVMASRRKGCILFTASSCTSPIGGLVSHPYVMSKYGIMGLVKNLSAELGQYGIRVNCISPSAVPTRISPFAGFNIRAIEVVKALKFIFKSGGLRGHRLTPESVARAALYLASDDANLVTGHNLVVDGGYN